MFSLPLLLNWLFSINIKDETPLSLLDIKCSTLSPVSAKASFSALANNALPLNFPSFLSFATWAL